MAVFGVVGVPAATGIADGRVIVSVANGAYALLVADVSPARTTVHRPIGSAVDRRDFWAPARAPAMRRLRRAGPAAAACAATAVVAASFVSVYSLDLILLLS